MENFVIYDQETGLLDGGAGRVDRNETPDGSTMMERINAILDKDAGRAVAYFPEGTLFDPEKHKVADGKIVEIKPGDRPEPEPTLAERVEALEAGFEALQARA